MKKQFTAKSKIDYKTYRRFAQFQLFKGKNPVAKKALIYGLGSVSAVFLILRGISRYDNRYLILGGIILLCIGMFSYLTGQVPKRQYKKDRRMVKADFDFIFAPDGLIVEVTGEDFENKEEIFYSDMQKIYETPFDYYLYADRMKAYIVPKSGLIDTTPDEAAQFLKSKVPDYKYITVNRIIG